MKWVLSARAQAEVRLILSVSGDQFGASAQRRYRLLLEQAIEDVADNPARAGVKRVSGGIEAWAYHTRYARLRTPAKQRVSRPRHVIVFAIRGDGIEVLRVLHDAMDLPTRLRDI